MVMQLFVGIDMWTEFLEAGGQIGVIYTDLEKYFYEVPQIIFIQDKIYLKSIQKLSSG